MSWLHQAGHRLGQGDMPPAATESQGSRHAWGPSATATWAPWVLQENSLLTPLGCAKSETATVFWASPQTQWLRVTIPSLTIMAPGVARASRSPVGRWASARESWKGPELAACMLLVWPTTSSEQFLGIRA